MLKQLKYIILFLTILSVKINAQDTTTCVVLDFEREYFYSESDNKTNALFDLINVYKQNSQYRTEIKTILYHISEHCEELNDSILSRLYYELQLASLLNNDIMSTVRYYNKLHSLKLADSTYLLKSEIADLFLLNETESFEMFYEKFKTLINNDTLINFALKRDSILLKLKKAQNWSFVPGFGQYYLGFKKEGAFAFFLNSCSITGTVLLYTNGFIILPSIVLVPFSVRTYIGSKKFTQKIGATKLKKINAQIKKQNIQQLKLYFCADSCF